MAEYFYYHGRKILLHAVYLLQHFKLLIEELHVKGEGKVKKAMKESFKILNEVRTPQLISGFQHHVHLLTMTAQCPSVYVCVLGCSVRSGKPV